MSDTLTRGHTLHLLLQPAFCFESVSIHRKEMRVFPSGYDRWIRQCVTHLLLQSPACGCLDCGDFMLLQTVCNIYSGTCGNTPPPPWSFLDSVWRYCYSNPHLWLPPEFPHPEGVGKRRTQHTGTQGPLPRRLCRSRRDQERAVVTISRWISKGKGLNCLSGPYSSGHQPTKSRPRAEHLFRWPPPHSHPHRARRKERLASHSARAGFQCRPAASWLCRCGARQFPHPQSGDAACSTECGEKAMRSRTKKAGRNPLLLQRGLNSPLPPGHWDLAQR